MNVGMSRFPCATATTSKKVVEDGRQAVKAALEGKFYLVFMDVQMPEMDGFEAVTMIRKAESRAQKSSRP
jgi:CheY-like chemotaxis protein